MFSTLHPSTVTNWTDVTPDDFNMTTTSNSTLTEVTSEQTALLDFVILPLSVIGTVIIMVGLVAFVIRKKRLDKLRHHLMPLYSFDPAEEGEDWEAELLEEGIDHHTRLKSNLPSEKPQLSFRSNL